MGSLEKVKFGFDRHPAVTERPACVIPVAVDDVIPLVRQVFVRDEVETVVLVPVLVVRLEVR